PISTASSSALAGIADSNPERNSFQLSAQGFILFFSMALIHVSRLRTRQGTGEHARAVVPVVLLLVASILIYVVPYRLLHHRSFEKIDYGGNRCYVVGQSDIELLTY